VYNLTPGLVPYEPVPGVPSLFNPFINIIPVQDFVAVVRQGGRLLPLLLVWSFCCAVCLLLPMLVPAVQQCCCWRSAPDNALSPSLHPSFPLTDPPLAPPLPQMYAALGFATRGTTLYFKIIMLPIAGTLASGVVLTPVTMFVQFLFNLVWKWTVSGGGVCVCVCVWWAGASGWRLAGFEPQVAFYDYCLE
jgi:hypothetical protein